MKRKNSINTPAKWKIAYLKAAAAIGDDDPLTFREGGGPDAFEDDGALHVRRFGVRVVFDVGQGQSLDGRKQNERTRTVLDVLGIEATERTLVDETEQEEES